MPTAMECAWFRVPRNLEFIRDNSRGAELTGSIAQYQPQFTADIAVMQGLVSAARQCELSSTQTMPFLWQVVSFGWMTRGIQLAMARERIAALEQQVANPNCPAPPPPQPCPECAPAAPCPAHTQTQIIPTQTQAPSSFGVSVGWLAGGLVAGAGLTYLLRK